MSFCCHATPDSDEAFLTPATPEDAVAEALAARTRTSSSMGTSTSSTSAATTPRLVNPGSVGWPHENSAARTGRCSARRRLSAHRVRLRGRGELILASGYPNAQYAAETILDPPKPEEATEHFEKLRGAVATSAKPGARRAQARPDRTDHRPPAAEHPDATIALRFGSPVELLVSVMLSAQTTDVNVNRVTERLFVKYRRPEDYLAVPQEELERDIFATGFYRQKAKSAARDDADAARRVRRRGAPTIEELVRLPGSRGRPPTSSPPSSGSRRASWSTRTFAGCRSGSG